MRISFLISFRYVVSAIRRAVVAHDQLPRVVGLRQDRFDRLGRRFSAIVNPHLTENFGESVIPISDFKGRSHDTSKRRFLFRHSNFPMLTLSRSFPVFRTSRRI